MKLRPLIVIACGASSRTSCAGEMLVTCGDAPDGLVGELPQPSAVSAMTIAAMATVQNRMPIDVDCIRMKVARFAPPTRPSVRPQDAHARGSRAECGKGTTQPGERR